MNLTNLNAQELDAKEEINLADMNLEEYTGIYYCEEIDTTYRLFLEDGILKVKGTNNNPLNLESSDINQFISQGNLVRFSRSNGVLNGFELDAGRVKFVKK